MGNLFASKPSAPAKAPPAQPVDTAAPTIAVAGNARAPEPPSYVPSALRTLDKAGKAGTIAQAPAQYAGSKLG
ncbi:MAG: hypothetical protein HXY30_19710 [Pseudorhodoplanes sp.]|nr:hypothetical protein [Pseudorhodoplanes sp.]